MPILTYTTSDQTHGGILNSRVLIGRRLSHGISLPDQSVSRLHAWIDPIADEHAEWVVTDAGSKTGTFVNDQPITRHPLHDGDVIRVGDVTITYRDQDQLPADVIPVELIAPPVVDKTMGILFECACGSPLWVGYELAGKRGMCRHCRNPVTVPTLAEDKPPVPATEPPVEPPVPGEPEPIAETVIVHEPLTEPAISAKRKSMCAVCHSQIAPGEEMTTCPDCAMVFHVECWQENFGCSSYGCPQVNCLAPEQQQQPVEIEQLLSVDYASAGEQKSFPWELILLAASVVATVLGALAYGIPAAVVAVISLAVLIFKRPVRATLLIGAILICIVGIFGGIMVSDLFFYNASHLPPKLMKFLHV